MCVLYNSSNIHIDEERERYIDTEIVKSDYNIVYTSIRVHCNVLR